MEDELGDDEDFRRRYMDHYSQDHVHPNLRRFQSRVGLWSTVLLALSVLGGAIAWKLTGSATIAQVVFWPVMVAGCALSLLAPGRNRFGP